MSIYPIIFWSLLLSALLTLIFAYLYPKIGGNLYSPVRGGTPRGVGLAPFIVLILFFPFPGNVLIAIMGILAFFDDIIGRRKIYDWSIEIGQLFRGLGLLLVMGLGLYYWGLVAILMALMIQPLNIADMQPGTACSTVIIMSLLLLGILASLNVLYLPVLIILSACLGYAPLDFKGRIMLGEVGNHSMAIALGICYIYLAQLLGSLSSSILITGMTMIILFIFTVTIITLLRRNNLSNFLKENLHISTPNFGDCFMDVLTGGGLGDLCRRMLLNKRQIQINNPLLIILGFRRLFFNPHAK